MDIVTLGQARAQGDRRYPRLDRSNPLGLDGWYVVGTRPPTDFTGAGAANVGYNGRMKDYLAVDCTDIRLVYTSPLVLENDGVTTTVATSAGVETASAGAPSGTIYPVTFHGRSFGYYDAGGVVVSDVIPGPFAKGPIFTRTFSTSLTGFVGQISTTSGSTTATITSTNYAVSQLTRGSGIFGAGITGFTTTITALTQNADGTYTITLSAAATSTATGTVYANAGQGVISHKGYIDGNDFGAAPSLTSPDLSKSGTLTSNTANTTGPTLILGRIPKGATPPPCVAILGDSISFRTGWTATDYPSRQGTGWATIGLGAGGAAGSTPAYDTPFVNIAKGSETGAQFAALANSYRRRRVLGWCTHAVVMYGANDLSINVSLATLQATLTSIWTQLANAGIRVWAATITPQTTSTDTWATTGNQSLKLTTAEELVRTQVNDWIRTKPAPLTGYIETADTVETARNSGIWKVGYVFTGDGMGLHPSNTGHLAMAAAMDRTKFTVT